MPLGRLSNFSLCNVVPRGLVVTQMIELHSQSLGFPRSETGEGNGIPLQYSSLENPMDGGAW